jgi:hypothetical protein
MTAQLGDPSGGSGSTSPALAEKISGLGEMAGWVSVRHPETSNREISNKGIRMDGSFLRQSEDGVHRAGNIA